MDNNANYSSIVRDQYENFPYPYRDPEHETRRLLQTALDPLCRINHYCFKGKININDNFRVLVAGGGTGDSVIFLAEQLKKTSSEVVYLDLSENSMAVAQQRAKKRNLTNIKWINGSILDLSQLDLGKFDYINCSGVLHHLENPDEGFNALYSVLKENGAIGLMLYGKYGRTAVYQFQELLRLIHHNEDNMQTKVDNAKVLLNSLPESNWLNHSKSWLKETLHGHDVDIYDMFLHSTDRAYSVDELYEWFVDKHKLNIHIFNDTFGYLMYEPFTYIQDEKIRLQISDLPIRKKQHIAELMSGNLFKHNLYITNKPDTEADINDLDNVPSFSLQLQSLSGKQFSDYLLNNAEQPISIKSKTHEFNFVFKSGVLVSHIIRHMDGINSLREIFNIIRNDNQYKNQPLTDQHLLDEFKSVYNTLKQVDGILLRHKNVDNLISIQTSR